MSLAFLLFYLLSETEVSQESPRPFTPSTSQRGRCGATHPAAFRPTADPPPPRASECVDVDHARGGGKRGANTFQSEGRGSGVAHRPGTNSAPHVDPGAIKERLS